MKNLKLCILATVATLFLISCATGTNPDDPYESFNRSVWSFNKGLDKVVLRPLAIGYEAVTPDPVEKGVSNFFSNLGEVPTILNSLLQFKFANAGKATGRLLINSTLGLGGLLDPATDMGIEQQEEDFGQTLAEWGYESSSYIMLPFLGPSTVRDGFGRVVDTVGFYSPYDDLNDDQTEIALRGTDLISTRASLLSLDDQLKSAPDDYLLVRDAYLQNRQFKIYDGEPPVEDDECEFEEDCEE